MAVGASLGVGRGCSRAGERTGLRRRTADGDIRPNLRQTRGCHTLSRNRRLWRRGRRRHVRNSPEASGVRRCGYHGFGGARERPCRRWRPGSARRCHRPLGQGCHRCRHGSAGTPGRWFLHCPYWPAGENLVLMANIVHDGADARVAGRGGLGAVMGSKLLKGVAVRGTKQVPVHDPDALKQLMRETVPAMREQAIGMHLFGTTGGVQRAEEVGDLPIRNWRDGSFPQAAALSGQAIAERLTGRYHCASCPIGCGRTVRLHVEGHEGRDGAGLEYESVGALGSLLMLTDLDDVEQAASLCNVLGLDTISTGGTLATAMEARELGLITAADTDGIDLVWGNGAAVLAMIPRIARRQGFGTRLADGSRTFAASVGHRELAIEVKGMELPAHDPRAYVSLGLGYATATRGACHLQGFSYAFERAATMPEIGLTAPMDRFDHTGKVAMVKATQDLMGLFDSLKFCKFAIYGGLNLTQMGQFLTAVTGRRLSTAELMEIGERIYTYKRLLATRMGISRADDTLPERLLSADRGGSVAGHLAWLDADVLNEYYDLRGWDRSGIPTVATVKRLSIDQLSTVGLAPEG